MPLAAVQRPGVRASNKTNPRGNPGVGNLSHEEMVRYGVVVATTKIWTKVLLDQLLKLLVECAAVREPRSCSRIKERLPQDIRMRLPAGGTMLAEIDGLVSTCAAFPDGLAELVAAVRWFEGDTHAMAEVLAFVGNHGMQQACDEEVEKTDDTISVRLQKTAKRQKNSETLEQYLLRPEAVGAAAPAVLLVLPESLDGFERHTEGDESGLTGSAQEEPGEGWPGFLNGHSDWIVMPVDILGRTSIVIGRARSCTVRLPNSSVSAVHALLSVDRNKGVVFVRDMDSRNGTRVNGERLEPGDECVLWDGVMLSLGDTVAVYVGPAAVRRISRLKGGS